MQENVESHDRRNAVLRLILGTAGALAALLIVAAVLRPDMMSAAMHDMMAMLR